MLPPVKIQRNTKITKKKKKEKKKNKKNVADVLGGRENQQRTSLEHHLQGTCDHIRLQNSARF